MNLLRAKEIIAALAEGINPITGEILPAEDSCNQGDVVRAYYASFRPLMKKKRIGRKMQDFRGQSRMMKRYVICLKKEKVGQRCANILSGLKEQLPQDWFALALFRTEMLFVR